MLTSALNVGAEDVFIRALGP